MSEADRIGDQVEEWFPGAGWGVKAFEMCRQFSSASVEWGFRTAYAKSLRGERISYRRVVGLVNFAEENPMSAEVRGPAQPARAAPAPPRSAPTYSDDQKAEIARKLKERTAKHASRCG
ncbi:MAG TPA: hypothetical protein VG820_09490 [Fimbriimonadaceae bacterium]|nr:hypothetical protein [Fimbriimonadaceae bacterium]